LPERSTAMAQPQLNFESASWAEDKIQWGHASAWEQLGGERRRVSCVVILAKEPSDLASILDSISDGLTEAGYPWEVLIVYSGADEMTVRCLNACRRRPGFQLIEAASHLNIGQLLTLGLARSRGDAVLVMEASEEELSIPIPAMVSRWFEGLEIVISRRLTTSKAVLNDALRACGLRPPPFDPATSEHSRERRDDILVDGVLLLDRKLVDQLLGNNEVD
jgi:hypothetical protein